MRRAKEIQEDIERLRKELNAVISEKDADKSNSTHVPTDKILKLSQEMDSLINEYQKVCKEE